MKLRIDISISAAFHDFKLKPYFVTHSRTLHLQSSKFGEHNGSLIMGSLSQQSIMAYDKNTGRTKKLWAGIGRVRDLAELPSGDLVVLIDKGSPKGANPGRILKLDSY